MCVCVCVCEREREGGKYMREYLLQVHKKEEVGLIDNQLLSLESPHLPRELAKSQTKAHI